MQVKHIFNVIAVLLVSCGDSEHTQAIDHVTEDHTAIVIQDLQNKQYELDILRELYVAQLNRDEDAFQFYVTEYIKVPRLTLTDEQKQHHMYKEWISDEIIKSGKFMNETYNFTTSSHKK